MVGAILGVRFYGRGMDDSLIGGEKVILIPAI